MMKIFTNRLCYLSMGIFLLCARCSALMPTNRLTFSICNIKGLSSPHLKPLQRPLATSASHSEIRRAFDTSNCGEKNNWWKNLLQNSKKIFGGSKSCARSVQYSNRFPIKSTSLPAVLSMFSPMMTLLIIVFTKRKTSWASGIVLDVPATASSPTTAMKGIIVWGALFIFTSVMHSAETAITKISPWKIQVRA
jgi:hypothetical protein